MGFLGSFLRRHLVGKPVVALPNVGCFLMLDNKKYRQRKIAVYLFSGWNFARSHLRMQALPREGHSRFQVMGMIEGFLWVGKFGKYFLGIQNNLKIRGSAHITRPHSAAIKVQPNLFFFLEIFKARKFVMGFIWG